MWALKEKDDNVNRALIRRNYAVSKFDVARFSFLCPARWKAKTKSLHFDMSINIFSS